MIPPTGADSLLASQVVYPGQSVCKLPDTGQLRVGPGLEANNNALCTTKSGILRKTKVGKLWVEGRQKRYYIRSLARDCSLSLADSTKVERTL